MPVTPPCMGASVGGLSAAGCALGKSLATRNTGAHTAHTKEPTVKGHTIQQVRACAPAAPAGDTVEGPVGLRRKIKAYIHLTKPR